MKNPAAGIKKLGAKTNGKENKGNLPYLRFRRKMRKNIFGKMP